MKYKVGNKIEIKTWDELAIEFGIDSVDGNVKTARELNSSMEESIKKANTNRIFTIKEIIDYNEDPQFEFKVEEFRYIIARQWIKRISQENKFKPTNEIISRFELLDL